MQDKNCWCSNYAPGNTVPISYCNKTCPGYPDDLCGNVDNGYFGFISMGKAAAGTIGASSNTPTTTSSTPVSTHHPTWTFAKTLAAGRPAQLPVLPLQARAYDPDSTSSTTFTNTFTRIYYGEASSSSFFIITTTTTSTSYPSLFTSVLVLTDSLQAPPSSTSSSSSQLQTSPVSQPQPVTQSQDTTTVVSYVTLVCIRAFVLRLLIMF